MKDKPSALPFRGGLIMLPKGNFHQNGYFTYKALCAVIHVVWIAAFLSLAEFTIVLYHTLPARPFFYGRVFHI